MGNETGNLVGVDLANALGVEPKPAEQPAEPAVEAQPVVEAVAPIAEPVSAITGLADEIQSIKARLDKIEIMFGLHLTQ